MSDTVPHIAQHVPVEPDPVTAAPSPLGNPDPIPGGNVPTEVPPMEPGEVPDIGPTGPRSPYPVNDPGIGDPMGPGSEPDYLPGRPTSPMQV